MWGELEGVCVLLRAAATTATTITQADVFSLPSDRQEGVGGWQEHLSKYLSYWTPFTPPHFSALLAFLLFSPSSSSRGFSKNTLLLPLPRSWTMATSVAEWRCRGSSGKFVEKKRKENVCGEVRVSVHSVGGRGGRGKFVRWAEEEDERPEIVCSGLGFQRKEEKTERREAQITRNFFVHSAWFFFIC